MCMLAILYRVTRNTPILVAADREESLARPSQYPKIQPGTPRVVCGIDRQPGGTWLGVNQYGLMVAVMNRRKAFPPLEPRSRGLLCRELLDLRNAREATERAVKELTGRYAGANYLCVDAKFGAVVYGGNRVDTVELTPGLHILGASNLDDPRDEAAGRRPPHADAVHVGLGRHVPGRGQPRLRPQGGRRRPSRGGAQQRRFRHRVVHAVVVVAEDPAIDLPIRPGTSEVPYDDLWRCCGKCSRPGDPAARPTPPRRTRRRSGVKKAKSKTASKPPASFDAHPHRMTHTRLV